MGEVKRYDSYGYDGLSGLMKEHADGDWVRSEDYDALRAENDRHRYLWETELSRAKDAENSLFHSILENAELVAALIEAQKIINHQGWSASEQTAYDAIDAALAKHRGDATQPTDKP